MHSKKLVNYISIITRFGVRSPAAVKFEEENKQDAVLLRRIATAKRQYKARQNRIKRP